VGDHGCSDSANRDNSSALEHGHVNGVSPRGPTTTASPDSAVKLSSGVGSPALISGGLESVSRVRLEMERRSNSHEELLTTSPHGQTSNGSPAPSDYLASRNGDVVLIAAGHEITMLAQQCSRNIGAVTSPGNQRAVATESSMFIPNRKQADNFSNAAAATAYSNQHGTVGDPKVMNRSTPDRVLEGQSNRCRRRPRQSSSDVAVSPPTSTKTHDYDTVSQYTSSSGSVQSNSDSVYSSSSACNSTGPSSNNSPRLSAAALSATDSDVDRRSNGIGRSQLLRKMLQSTTKSLS